MKQKQKYILLAIYIILLALPNITDAYTKQEKQQDREAREAAVASERALYREQELRDQQTVIMRETATQETQEGTASWYALDGNRTASGEIMDSSLMTAASNTYPLGSMLRVENVDSGDIVYVRVNDTGGFTRLGRVIDLSLGAFDRIASPSSGLVRVRINKVW